jgi:predicted ATPase
MERFKCFDSLTLPISPLTLFTGFNAAGKSTALQTLLLLSQTLRSQKGAPELRLKGPLANLGTPADIINRIRGGSELALGLRTDEVELLWRFTVTEDSRRALRATRLEFIWVWLF